ncbi:negative cofactor 2 transcription regulator complex subunit ncb2 [Gaertneriomyces sp. JEL0708]|nr:negative cofactor 2 transcription regulator complex subunit ncb2 [Gaertneriomyces sp. JEL0708]
MDDDYETTTGGTEEELSLPKATVTKVIQDMMPEDLSCAKETKDLIADCCVEFIHLISGEANEICEREQKKTINGEHIIAALQTLGFENYLKDVTDVMNDHNKQAKEREKRVDKLKTSGMTQEELEKAQEQLFAQARMRMQSQSGPSSPS